MKRKKISRGLILLFCLNTVANPFIDNLFVNKSYAIEEDWKYIDEDCEEENAKKMEQEEGNYLTDDSEEAWLVEGTIENVQAKAIFSYLTEDFGLSGAATAGIMANIRGESNFIPDLAERGDWSDKSIKYLRFGMDSKIPPEGAWGWQGPSTRATNNFGGGLFQFTPFTKYTESKYWEIKNVPLNNNVGFTIAYGGWRPYNQLLFVWDSAFKNKNVMMYVKSTNPSYGAARYGVSPPFNTIEEWLSTNDPVASSIAFQVGYERPAKYHKEREDWARIANTVFNTENVQADPSKWKFDDSDIDLIVSNSGEKNNKCKNKKEQGNLASWGNDGTGYWDASNGTVWRPDNLPAELKQYALDPQSLGMGWHNSKNWTNTGTPGAYYGNQCVNLSSSFFNWLWTRKDGSFLLKARGSTSAIGVHDGNGRSMAKTFAIEYGGSLSKVSAIPRKGAISGVFYGANSPGHTYIVSHVFANGDILIVEQNHPGYSGQLNGGEAWSWNYRYITKAKYESQSTEFYCPLDDGFVPNPQIRTIP